MLKKKRSVLLYIQLSGFTSGRSSVADVTADTVHWMEVSY